MTKTNCCCFSFLCLWYLPGDQNEPSRYSCGDDISGNESSDAPKLTETERQEKFNRHKEEMQKKKRRKKRTSSWHSSTFQGTYS